MLTQTRHFLKISLLMATAIGAMPHSALAQDDAVNPLYLNGGHISILGTATEFLGDGNRPDLGAGVDLLGGIRRGRIGLEAGLTSTFASQTSLLGGYANLLVFPFSKLPGLYGIGGMGILHSGKYPDNDEDFEITTTHLGTGYLFPLELFSYSMGLRVEGLYRYGRQNSGVTQQRPDTDPRNDPDPNAPDRFNDVILRVGLHVPLPLRSPEPPPTPTPVEVVPPVPPTDSDGDSVPDDVDQCPNTPPNTQVDRQGCPLPPPPPPCEAPAPGEKVSLAGCATGESIALRGVNFEHDETRLTQNAKAILDGVAEELTAYPGIRVEFSGHTDADGSEAYNQSLSNARAASVVEYLKSKGIAAARMSSVGYGESRPIAENDTDAGRELNRRVELKVTTSADIGANHSPAPVDNDQPLEIEPDQANDDVLEEETSPTPTSTPEARDDALETPQEQGTDEALDDLFSDF